MDLSRLSSLLALVGALNIYTRADTKKESSGSVIRRDLPYLRLIVKEAVRLHPRRPPEEHVMLTNLREYLMWLTIDALEDENLAKELLFSFATLEEELNVIKVDRQNHRLDPSALAFNEAFIQALRLALSILKPAIIVRSSSRRGHGLGRSWASTALMRAQARKRM